MVEITHNQPLHNIYHCNISSKPSSVSSPFFYSRYNWRSSAIWFSRLRWSVLFWCRGAGIPSAVSAYWWWRASCCLHHTISLLISNNNHLTFSFISWRVPISWRIVIWLLHLISAISYLQLPQSSHLTHHLSTCPLQRVQHMDRIPVICWTEIRS